MNFIIKYVLVYLCINMHFNAKGQDITAKLDYIVSNERKIYIQIDLKNETGNSLFLVGSIRHFIFKDYISDQVNYGSPKEDLKSRYLKLSGYLSDTSVHGCVKDTFNFTLPITEERYQSDFKGNIIDVFERISFLEEIYSTQQIKDTIYFVPEPPDMDTAIKQSFIDIDLYNLMQKENIDFCMDCSYPYQTVIFKPYESKVFTIDLSYLLLQKATYQFVLNFKSNDSLLTEETNFLEMLEFNRFKGRIVSNSIFIESR